MTQTAHASSTVGGRRGSKKRSAGGALLAMQKDAPASTSRITDAVAATSRVAARQDFCRLTFSATGATGANESFTAKIAPKLDGTRRPARSGSCRRGSYRFLRSVSRERFIIARLLSHARSLRNAASADLELSVDEP